MVSPDLSSKSFLGNIVSCKESNLYFPLEGMILNSCPFVVCN